MTVDEPTRHELLRWFAEQMPDHLAEAMMNSIPPTGWGDVATRTDLTAATVMLRGEMAELRAELHGDMTELRGEIIELRSELHGESAERRGDSALLRGELALAVSRTNRTVVMASAATALSTWGVVIAAVGLG